MALKPNGYIMLEEPDFYTFLAEGKPENSLTRLRYTFSKIKAALKQQHPQLNTAIELIQQFAADR